MPGFLCDLEIQQSQIAVNSAFASGPGQRHNQGQEKKKQEREIAFFFGNYIIKFSLLCDLLSLLFLLPCEKSIFPLVSLDETFL